MTLMARWTVKLAGKLAANRFEQAVRDVEGAQAAKLREIVDRNADTDYGRKHGFASIRTLEDYRKAVPVIEYEDIRPYVDRMARGESGVLTAEDPVMFAQTSGTTGNPKLIPVTPTCQGRDHRDQMRTWLYHALCAHPTVFDGKVLSMVSPAVEGHTEAGIPFGSTSGFMYRNLPKPIQATYLAPYDVFEVEDYDAKYYVLMLLGLVSDVSFLCTANPSTIAKLCEVVSERADELIADVRNGYLRQDLNLPAGVRKQVNAMLKPDADRARELDAMRGRRDGRLLPADLWPNLALIGCWKGGTVGAYVKSFPEWFDPDGKRPVPVRDWGYLSSEARGSIPLTDEGSAGVATIGSNLLEFVPVEDVERNPDDPAAWNCLGAHQVEAQREYHVIFTTTGGLYRYDINDIVRVEGFYEQAPLLTFQRKGRGMTSLTGEKVSVNQVIEAVDAAADEVGVKVLHFKALAAEEAARYEFQVECEGEVPEAKAAELLRAIEAQLAERNLEYAGKRKSHRLEEPALFVMRPGWYDRAKRKQGQRLFQSKTVLLEPRDPGEDPVEEEECALAVQYQ